MCALLCTGVCTSTQLSKSYYNIPHSVLITYPARTSRSTSLHMATAVRFAQLPILLLALLSIVAAATPDEEPPPLPPVLWYAPFLSGGGYCSEAIGFLQALESVGGVPVRAEQHGDSINPGRFSV